MQLCMYVRIIGLLCIFTKYCRCWISDENGANWAFTAPMIVIILVNCFYCCGLVHDSMCIYVDQHCYFDCIIMQDLSSKKKLLGFD